MKKGIIKKSIFVLILLLLICCTNSYATKPDYLQDVDLDFIDSIFETIKKYNGKYKIQQKELTMDNTGVFTDDTVIRRVEVEPGDKLRENKIAVTLDDSFVIGYTYDILDVLEKHNCQATFFITSTIVGKKPKMVYDIVKKGHELGNHSVTHIPFKNQHPSRVVWEISTMQQLVQDLTGIKMTLFRHPTGSYDAFSISTSKAFGLYPVNWTIDSEDWRLQDKEQIMEKIKQHEVKSGEILLLHNGYACSKETIDEILTYYESLGFSFIKLSDLLYTSDFEVRNGVQFKVKKDDKEDL